MATKVFKPQIAKLGLASEMRLVGQVFQFFHPQGTKIDDKLYNVFFQIKRLLS